MSAMIQGTAFLTAAARDQGWADQAERPDHHHDDHHHHGPADGIVARVADHTVTVPDLDARLAAIYRGPMRPRLPSLESPEGRRVRRWAAQLITTEALVLAEARRLRLPAPARPPVVPPGGPVAANGADPVTEQIVDRAVGALFTVVTEPVQVPAAEVRAFYDDNPDLWRSPEARTVRQAVRPIPVAVREDELDPPYELGRGELAGAVEDAVFGAAVGELVGPVRGPLSWHTVLVVAARPAGVMPFEQVSARIEADLLDSARGATFDDWLSQRRSALVRLAPGYEHPGDPSAPDFVHRH